jgi:hypothetical protein
VSEKDPKAQKEAHSLTSAKKYACQTSLSKCSSSTNNSNTLLALQSPSLGSRMLPDHRHRKDRLILLLQQLHMLLPQVDLGCGLSPANGRDSQLLRERVAVLNNATAPLLVEGMQQHFGTLGDNPKKLCSIHHQLVCNLLTTQTLQRLQCL